MNIGESGKQLIKKYEGCRLEAYKCPAGAWTIGWGHTANVYEGMQVTQTEADKMFDDDIKRYEAPVQEYSGLNQNQFDALTSFCYNCGAGALADVMSSGDITRTMKLYVKGGGVTLPGLVRRRDEEVALYNTPSGQSTTENGTYTVKEGDTLSAIAAEFGVTVDQLVAWNSIADRNSIGIGQVLKFTATTNTNTNVKKEEEIKVDYIIQYSNSTDQAIAEMMADRLMCPTINCLRPYAYYGQYENVIAVGEGKNRSGYTNVLIQGKDRKETLDLAIAYCKNLEK